MNRRTTYKQRREGAGIRQHVPTINLKQQMSGGLTNAHNASIGKKVKKKKTLPNLKGPLALLGLANIGK